jgi:hypothetical protein
MVHPFPLSVYIRYVLVSTREREGGWIQIRRQQKFWYAYLPLFHGDMGKRRKMLHRIDFLSLLFGKESPVEKGKRISQGKGKASSQGKGRESLPRGR